MEEIDPLQNVEAQDDGTEKPEKSRTAIKKEARKQKWLADKEKRKQREKVSLSIIRP